MEFKKLKCKKREGFTLVEMVLVVTILGILSGIGFMQFGNIQETSKKNADYVAAANLATATKLYITEHLLESNYNGSVSISDLKSQKYIAYEPKPQSGGNEFTINVSNGEIQVFVNKNQIYPKTE